YAFSGLGPGTYRVRQVLPAGWQQTTADPAALSAASGTNVSGLDFGAFQKVSLSGVVFQDTDGDGAQGAGEAGLSGRTVYLDANGSGTLDQAERSPATDPTGAYSFTGLGTSTYRVRQVLPAGWAQTTADPDITPSSGTDVTGVNFGAFQRVT